MTEEFNRGNGKSNDVEAMYVCGTSRECCYHNTKCELKRTPNGHEFCARCL